MQNSDSITKLAPRYERLPLAGDQVKDLVAVADEEWKGMILTGLYTGQRLLDIAGLRWSGIDLEHDTIRFYFAKQGRPFVCPMTTTLKAHFGSLAKPADGEAPVFPTCFKDAQEGHGKLAARFRYMQEKAGLKPVGFYSLRYTFAYGLRRVGTPAALAQQAIGMSDWRYRAMPMEEVRKALERLPGFQQ